MDKRSFLEKHKIVRSSIKQDVLHFALPAFFVFSAGLVVSAMNGYDGLLKNLWRLILHPGDLYVLPTEKIVGLVLCVIGFTVVLVALCTLKHSYSSTLVIKEDHQLITNGIYRFIRHPIYFGVIIVCFAVPVYAFSLYGFIVMSALIPLGLNRIRMEEELLTEEYGDVYRAYKKTSRKLIPFIY
ncbi:methyltransferase family protein [candidate division KSB1 bacterium]